MYCLAVALFRLDLHISCVRSALLRPTLGLIGPRGSALLAKGRWPPIMTLLVMQPPLLSAVHALLEKEANHLHLWCRLPSTSLAIALKELQLLDMTHRPGPSALCSSIITMGSPPSRTFGPTMVQLSIHPFRVG